MEEFTIRRAIVTGATGMIGSELIRQMVAEDIEVLAVVRPDTKKLSNLPQDARLQVVECDVRNLGQLLTKAQGTYDVFYHFAWNGCFGEARNDLHSQVGNVESALQAVDVAHELGCKKFIGAGSQAEFGPVEGKLSDALPKNPVTGYGIAKYSACLMTRERCKQLGMAHHWGRILSCYGPGDNAYTMVMSAVLGMKAGKRLAFTPGEQLWDYIYVSDCAGAFYAMARYGTDGKAYTIGSGQVAPLKDYIYQIRDAVAPSLEVGIGEMAYYPNQVMHLEADIRELQQDCGWNPKVDFAEGIRRTVQSLSDI